MSVQIYWRRMESDYKLAYVNLKERYIDLENKNKDLLEEIERLEDRFKRQRRNFDAKLLEYETHIEQLHALKPEFKYDYPDVYEDTDKFWEFRKNMKEREQVDPYGEYMITHQDYISFVNDQVNNIFDSFIEESGKKGYKRYACFFHENGQVKHYYSLEKRYFDCELCRKESDFIDFMIHKIGCCPDRNSVIEMLFLKYNNRMAYPR
jgi:hypothetical protein